ncbi:hypothetical protein [Kyrpidia tusciae]|uniref:Uncharacterized protein n=1 Tax=Kyrpidia tusciae (strain DSM 2912 / NBRC 15312 / T2) TaxID=562970 RepID=D5WVM8_KYRT2|nr:hypothetical protein [Kyrpidia tusciae]ADG07571.1 hypothetical protein Btus_2937 [Kyrpidia tusciae DSM 2912]
MVSITHDTLTDVLQQRHGCKPLVPVDGDGLVRSIVVQPTPSNRIRTAVPTASATDTITA